MIQNIKKIYKETINYRQQLANALLIITIENIFTSEFRIPWELIMLTRQFKKGDRREEGEERGIVEEEELQKEGGSEGEKEER